MITTPTSSRRLFFSSTNCGSNFSLMNVALLMTITVSIMSAASLLSSSFVVDGFSPSATAIIGGTERSLMRTTTSTFELAMGKNKKNKKNGSGKGGKGRGGVAAAAAGTKKTPPQEPKATAPVTEPKKEVKKESTPAPPTPAPVAKKEETKAPPTPAPVAKKEETKVPPTPAPAPAPPVVEIKVKKFDQKKQPLSSADEERVAAKYAAIEDLGERVFVILQDLEMFVRD